MGSLAIGLVVILPHIGVFPNFMYCLPILVFVWLYLKYFDEGFRDIGFSFKAFKIRSLLIGIAAGLILFAFSQLVLFPLLGTMINLDETEVGLYDFIKESKTNYLFVLAMGWIVGGIYEEIVFHGFIFTRMEKMISGKRTLPFAFIGTSVLFGVYHIQLGLADMINAFVIGIAYLFLFLQFKRNLWHSIVSHGVYNSLAISGIYFGYV